MCGVSVVSATYLWRTCHVAFVCATMCDVWTAYLTCHVLATKCIHEKRSTSAYEEYELRIEEYELCVLAYVRRTCDDVPFES